MIIYDCHTHTCYSDDSKASVRSQLDRAVELGLKGICITDHMDYQYPSTQESGVGFEYDIKAHWQEMCRMREEYKDKLEILIGMEAGLRNETGLTEVMTARYSELEGQYPLDFIIGSTHCLEYTDPYYPKYWQDKTETEGLHKYFAACAENAESYDFFDSFGHLDYIVRYVPKSDNWRGVVDYNPKDYFDEIDVLLKTLIYKGKALECNSSGIKYGLGFPHPAVDILKRYFELGGELLTIGSDGHEPKHLAYDFNNVCGLLSDIGYRYYTVYKGRKPMQLPLR